MNLSIKTEQAFLGCLIRAPEIYNSITFLLNKNYFAFITSIELYEIIAKWIQSYKNVENLTEAEFLIFLETQYNDWYKRNNEFIKECFKLIPDKDLAIDKWELHFSNLKKFFNYRLIKEEIKLFEKELDSNPLLIGEESEKFLNNFNKVLSQTKSLSFESKISLEQNIREFKKEFLLRMHDDFSPSKFNLGQLDDLVGGYFPFSFNLITARSSVGKSAFVNTIVRNMVMNQRKKIIVFNLETGNFPFLMRWISKDLLLDSRLIKEPKRMSEEERKNVMLKTEEILEKYQNYLFLIDNIYYVEDIIQQILYLHSNYKIDGVFIDLLEYVKTREKTESRTRELAFISNEFFNLTRSYPFWITLIQQQNKEGEKKAEQSAGRYAEDPFLQADCVIGIYHLENEDGEKDKNRRLIKVIKGRDNETGSVILKYSGKYTLFEDDSVGFELT